MLLENLDERLKKLVSLRLITRYQFVIHANGTKVNENTFREWKLKRDEFRNATKDEKDKDIMISKLTGVQLFQKSSDLFKDDENAADVKMDEIEIIASFISLGR